MVVGQGPGEQEELITGDHIPRLRLVGRKQEGSGDGRRG